MVSKKQKVMNKIKRRKDFDIPLVFREYSEEEIKKYKDMDLIKLCMEILRFSEKYPSKKASGENSGKIETTRGRRRSVGDIFRHIKYFKPEVTIFEVMEAMYSNKGQLAYNHCSTVHRLVFTRVLAGYGYGTDEFGLEFSDWKDINHD